MGEPFPSPRPPGETLMNLRALSPEQSRKLAIGLLFVVVIGAVAAVAVPVWLANRHYDRALADMTDRLERYTRLAATRPEIAKQLEAIRARDVRRYFLRAGGAALSAAEVQEAVRVGIESNGGKLIAIQVPASKEDGRYRQVSVNVQLTANIEALRKIMHRIENGTPVLFIDNLTVRSQVPSTFKPQPGGEPEMFVQFDLYGYSLAGA
jgi:general secretion pathway protein M